MLSANNMRIKINHIHKGFTLIELLVVIAIIGVLSSVVLSSLNTARNKGGDAAVRSNLGNARTQAELFYDTNNNQYVITAGVTTDVCAPTGNVAGIRGIYTNFFAAAQAAGLSVVNTTITTAGTVSTATCHACPISGAPCSNPFPNSWGAEVPLRGGGMFCTDSTGFSGFKPSSSLASSDTRCN